MPPKVREVKRLLRKLGYTIERPGKGDHTVFFNPTTKQQYSLDGPDSHELLRPVWLHLKKLLGLKG